jgi:hypothetical protein
MIDQLINLLKQLPDDVTPLVSLNIRTHSDEQFAAVIDELGGPDDWVIFDTWVMLKATLLPDNVDVHVRPPNPTPKPKELPAITALKARRQS